MHPSLQVLRRITGSSVGWGKLQVIAPKSQPPPAAHPGAPPSISLRLLPPQEGARNPFHMVVEVGVHRGPGRVAAVSEQPRQQQQMARFNANLLLSTLRWGHCGPACLLAFVLGHGHSSGNMPAVCLNALVHAIPTSWIVISLTSLPNIPQQAQAEAMRSEGEPAPDTQPRGPTRPRIYRIYRIYRIQLPRPPCHPAPRVARTRPPLHGIPAPPAADGVHTSGLQQQPQRGPAAGLVHPPSPGLP